MASTVRRQRDAFYLDACARSAASTVHVVDDLERGVNNETSANLRSDLVGRGYINGRSRLQSER
jgi:hypothetical protein